MTMATVSAARGRAKRTTRLADLRIRSPITAKAPPRARATALSLRLSGNRVGLVVFPFAVSLVATASGVAGVFVFRKREEPSAWWA